VIICSGLFSSALLVVEKVRRQKRYLRIMGQREYQLEIYSGKK
jgi:hypothetical protein